MSIHYIQASMLKPPTRKTLDPETASNLRGDLVEHVATGSFACEQVPSPT